MRYKDALYTCWHQLYYREVENEEDDLSCSVEGGRLFAHDAAGLQRLEVAHLATEVEAFQIDLLSCRTIRFNLL